MYIDHETVGEVPPCLSLQTIVVFGFLRQGFGMTRKEGKNEVCGLYVSDLVEISIAHTFLFC